MYNKIGWHVAHVWEAYKQSTIVIKHCLFFPARIALYSVSVCFINYTLCKAHHCTIDFPATYNYTS